MPCLIWSYLKQGEFADLGQVMPDQSQIGKTRSACSASQILPTLILLDSFDFLSD